MNFNFHMGNPGLKEHLNTFNYGLNKLFNWENFFLQTKSPDNVVELGDIFFIGHWCCRMEWHNSLPGPFKNQKK